MAKKTYEHPDPHLGEPPAQEIHFIDGGELMQFEMDGFSIYLGAALSLTSTGLSIGATLAAWQFSVPAEFSVISTNLGITFFALTFLLLGGGVALFIPGSRNWSSNKSLVTKIRNRLSLPGIGEQQSTPGVSDLPPISRNPSLIEHKDEGS